MNINYCVIVIFTYMGQKNIKSDKKIDITRGLGPVTKVQPEIKVTLDDNKTVRQYRSRYNIVISCTYVIKLEIRGKSHIMQLITLCEVNSRKCGSEVT